MKTALLLVLFASGCLWADEAEERAAKAIEDMGGVVIREFEGVFFPTKRCRMGNG